MGKKSVAHLNIIDLSSTATSEMLKQQISSESFFRLNYASTLPPYNLSEYGKEIVDAFATISPSKNSIKKTLIKYGPQMEHDNILNADRVFVEVTSRHL